MDSVTDLEQDANLHVEYTWNASDLNAQIRNNLASRCVQYPHDIPYGGFFFCRHVRHVMSQEA